MILGVGTDLVDIRRVERTLQRFGDRFTCRVFTPVERERATRRSRPAGSLAMAFAAKEACAKALGTGFRDGVFWSDIGVENRPSGQPVLVLSGGARRRLIALTPPGQTPLVHVSLTDEYPLAHAMVVISSEPERHCS